jgi:hypothetical protein
MQTADGLNDDLRIPTVGLAVGNRTTSRRGFGMTRNWLPTHHLPRHKNALAFALQLFSNIMALEQEVNLHLTELGASQRVTATKEF